MPAEPKYITINGVMKKNPNYIAANATATTVRTSNESLAIISSPNDFEIAQQIQEQKNQYTVPMSSSTSSAMEMLQDEDMLKRYKSSAPLDGGLILDSIGELFSKYETPFGLVNKLIMLSSHKLDFIIDDSGSMSSPTDVDAVEATEPVKTLIRSKLRREPRPGEKMSRIQEAEDRLHVLIDILALIPIEHIQIRFLNSQTVLVLDRSNKTPAEFQVDAHQKIRDQFATLNLGSTPVRKALQIGFDYPGKWSHYLFNDGEPNEGGAEIARQIINRRDPQNHPLTLVSCTNNDEDTAWMKKVDADATYVAEVDDFQDERDEVVKKQGAGFPYTRGVWLLCQLVASINPFDLDALDENLPLTKFTLDTILGRQLNPDEYQYYFERNPNAALYVNEYSRFLNEELFASQIIPKATQTQRERSAGYIDGEKPHHAALANISAQLAPVTAMARERFIAQYRAVAEATTQMSAVSIAPNAAFMPPAPGFRAIEPLPQYDPANAQFH